MTKLASFRVLSPICLAAASLFAGPALAHTSYLLPKVFNANTERMVTVESAFAEKFFQPALPVDSNDYHAILPDGSRGTGLTITPLKQIVVLESALETEGTYRFTTGVRHGRVGKSALVNGKWAPVHGEVPKDATQVRTSQTETVADVYVTKKQPTRPAVDAVVGRLRIQPVTHPSELYLGTPFEFSVVFDGKPMANQELVLDRGGADYEEAATHVAVKTDAQGKAVLKLERPGIYVLMTRHRADAPAGSTTDERSYTTSLTFQVEE